MDCGPTCLKIITKYYGKHYSIGELRERTNISREGVSLLSISDAAESLGFHTVGHQTSFQKLKEARFPCIVHWNQIHFVVVYRIKRSKIYIAMSLGLIIFSCNPTGEIVPVKSEDEKLISKEEAIEISMNFTYKLNTSGRLTGKQLKVHEIKGSHNKTALYIINNSAGGWQIIAGTNVEEPILAYSEKDSFDIDISNMNEGLKMWIGNSIAHMVLAYYSPEEYYVMFKNPNTSGRIEPPDDPCEDSYSEVSNFVTAQYTQWSPENLEAKTCDASKPLQSNGHAPIGCGPVAMAQVMQYYESPSSYSWGIIPNNPFYINGTTAAELEIAEILGDAKDSLEPYYYDLFACKLGAGSLTSSFNNLDKSFDVFGYDAYQFTASSTLVNEINALRPVIAVGGNAVEENRHIWVISGRKSHFFCESGNTYLWVWCNWGWNGDDNAWYGISGYTPPGYNFNQNLKYFKVIKR